MTNILVVHNTDKKNMSQYSIKKKLSKELWPELDLPYPAQDP